MTAPRFANVSCSQCGRDFGPGDHGFSHCDSHMTAAQRLRYFAEHSEDRQIVEAMIGGAAEIDRLKLGTMTFNEFHNAIRILWCVEYGEFTKCLDGFYDKPEHAEQWEKFACDPHRYFVSVSTGLASRLFAIIETRNAKRATP